MTKVIHGSSKGDQGRQAAQLSAGPGARRQYVPWDGRAHIRASVPGSAQLLELSEAHSNAHCVVRPKQNVECVTNILTPKLFVNSFIFTPVKIEKSNVNFH